MQTPPFNSQIYTEASDWLVEFRSGDIDASAKQAFCRWLQISPEHMRAYLELAAIWNEGAALDSSRIFDNLRLLQDIQADTNVVPIPAVSTQVSTTRRRASRGWLMGLAATVACAATSGLYWYLSSSQQIYATKLGQQRLVTLEDGSSVDLNAGSRVRVRFGRAQRDVDLLDGQALFHVAKDRARPFIVHAGSTDVRAVGTQFDVDKQPTGTTVTVVEGQVAVLYTAPEEAARSSVLKGAPGVNRATPPSVHSSSPQTRSTLEKADGGAVLLAAGQQVTVTGGGARKNDQADVAAATAWTHHELVFKGTPLQAVAEEFNRYNSRRLVIDDPELEKLKITGIFSSTDPSSLIRFLQARPEVVIVQTDREIRISRTP